jgi:hypothetical protein
VFLTRDNLPVASSLVHTCMGHQICTCMRVSVRSSPTHQCVCARKVKSTAQSVLSSSTSSVSASASHSKTLHFSCAQILTIAEGYLQNLASVACSTGVVDRGVGVCISRQYLSCALVRGRGIVFRHYYRSLAKSAGKDFRDSAVVPFE